MSVVLILGVVLALLAAAVHGYIFWLESIAWRGPRARRIFGTSAEEARITAPLALNQGFYNLFLAVATVLGVFLLATDATAAGATAVLIGTGSMLAASLVLVVSDRTKARAAAVQGILPAAAVLLLAIGLAQR